MPRRNCRRHAAKSKQKPKTHPFRRSPVKKVIAPGRPATPTTRHYKNNQAFCPAQPRRPLVTLPACLSFFRFLSAFLAFMPAFSPNAGPEIIKSRPAPGTCVHRHFLPITRSAAVNERLPRTRAAPATIKVSFAFQDARLPFARRPPAQPPGGFVIIRAQKGGPGPQKARRILSRGAINYRARLEQTEGSPGAL